MTYNIKILIKELSPKQTYHCRKVIFDILLTYFPMQVALSRILSFLLDSIETLHFVVCGFTALQLLHADQSRNTYIFKRSPCSEQEFTAIILWTPYAKFQDPYVKHLLVLGSHARSWHPV